MAAIDEKDAEQQALDTTATPVVNDDAQMAAIQDAKGQVDESRPDAPQGNTAPLKQAATPEGQPGTPDYNLPPPPGMSYSGQPDIPGQQRTPPNPGFTIDQQIEQMNAQNSTARGYAPDYENRPQVISANAIASAPATAERHIPIVFS